MNTELSVTDLFGVWRVSAPAQSTGVSFGFGETGTPTEPTWHVQLPDSIDAAQSILDAQRLALQRGDAAIAQAEQRLARLSRSGDEMSFAAPSGPEADLMAQLNALQSPVSFGLFKRDEEDVESHNQWLGFLGQIREMVSNYARVETTMARQFIGYTAVGWTGDFNTRWGLVATPESMRLHQQNVRLALASRLALMRLVGVVGTGAAGLAVRLAVPGGQLLALPAVWKFVKDVIKEVQQLRSVGN